MIEERRIDRIADAIEVTPGVHMISDQDAGTNIITVRGIGTNRNLPASIAFVIDGVVLPDSDAFTADLSDVERIEILKGPQGGLYGRNAIGGVINLTTRTPTNQLEGDVKVGYSSGETKDVFAAISGPLAGENLLGRIAVKYHDTDGLIENTFTGDNMDYDENTKVTGRLIWQATDALRSTCARRTTTRTPARSGSVPMTYSEPPAAASPRTSRRSSRARTIPASPSGRFSMLRSSSITRPRPARSRRSRRTTTSTCCSARIWTPRPCVRSPIRGRTATRPASARSSASRRRTKDASATSSVRTINRPTVTSIRARRSTTASSSASSAARLPAFSLSGIRVPTQLNILESEFNQWAVFAQGNYDLTDALELTVALRYDEDKREQHDLLGNRTDEATFSDFQPKVSLAWKATADLMFYATYAEGYKSGAFNPPPLPTQTFPLVVQQEGTTNYELGAKTTWFDDRLQVNAAVYHTDYEDVQVFRLDLQTGGQVAINANEARLQGVEIELATRPLENLELTAAYGYTDAEFTDFDGTGVFDGNRLPNTPLYTFNGAARYEYPLDNGLGIVSRVDYNRTGTIYFADENVGYQPTYDTVDAQVGLEADRWSVTVWGRNVLDERYASSVYMRSISPAIYGRLDIDAMQNEPGATYGAEFRWRF